MMRTFESQWQGDLSLATDVPMKRRDGEIIYADVNAFRLMLGGKQYLAGIFRDITERKEAEVRERAALGRLQAFEAAVNQGPGVVVRWRIVPHEWPVEMVTANVRQFGYESEDFISGRVSWPGITYPEDRPSLERQVKAHLKQRTNQFHQHYRLVTAAGEVRSVEDWNTLLYGPDGNPTHIQAIVMDVTDLREEERKRHESEERFRNLCEQSPNMIFINHGGRVVYANPRSEELMGYTREEFYAPDFDFRTLLVPECMPLVEQRFAQHMQGEEVPPCELILLTRDGEKLDVIHTTRLLDYEGGKAVLGILTDITARKKAERLRARDQRQLRHLAAKLAAAQDREQRRIAEGLHDDVAQILAVCSVKLGEAENAGNLAAARPIHDEIDDLLGQADQKLRSLSFELSSSTLYRMGLGEAVHELCGSMSERYAIRFRLEDDGHTADLEEATATVLFKAVRELLFNVVKHAHVKEATVSISRDDHMLKVVVEDHGTGFPQTPEGEVHDMGRGLGLFGIRERIRDLGGKMRIVSKPGESTRVTLWAPVEGGKSLVTRH
jgi:PAS domain S-box-containing protein